MHGATGTGRWKAASNAEFLVGAGHQPVPTTSLPFVHTARRYYRLDVGRRLVEVYAEASRGLGSRGSKSRNKVSVGEPAEGSFEGGIIGVQL